MRLISCSLSIVSFLQIYIAFCNYYAKNGTWQGDLVDGIISQNVELAFLLPSVCPCGKTGSGSRR